MTQTLRVVLRVALVAIVAVHVTAASASAQASADLYVQTSVWPNGPVPTGSSLSYFIEIDNFGPGDAETVVLNDRLPPQVTFGYAFPEECVFDEPSHSLSCDLGELPAGFFAFVEISVTAPSSPMTIVNSATVSSTTSDADSTNNTSTVATEVAQFNLSDLAVTVAVSPETALVHRVLTFVTNVTNLGPHDAAGVLLKLTPPVNADIISISSSQGPCETAELGDFDCRIGPLTVGASATITLTVKPQKDGLSLTFAYATGYDDPYFLDPNFLNDDDSAHVYVEYPGEANPAYANTTSERIPYSTYVYNPCANDIIFLTGTAHQIVSSTFKRDTHFHRNTLTNYSGLTGIGLFSGQTYRASGVSRWDRELSLVGNGWYPYAFTQVDNFRLVPDDGGDTLLLHENFHVTVNPDGTATSVHDNPTLECK